MIALAASILARQSGLGQTNEFIPLAPNWDKSFNLRASGGYNDNLLLSREPVESSYFINSGLDFTLFRLPLDGREFTLFLTSDYTWYPQGTQVDHEQFAAVFSHFKLELSPEWNAGFDLQYVYQDQVIDTSITETNPSPTLVQGHGMSARPEVRRALPSGFWLAANVGATRWLYKTPLDHYWEGGPQLSAGRDYGFKSSVSLSYQWRRRAYDTRPQATLEGGPVDGTLLEFTQNEIETVLRHNFDPQRHWRSVTSLGVLRNDDNGSGYFNFVRYQVSGQLRYVAKSWELRGQARLAHYDFSRQPADGADSFRQKDLLVGGLRGEKTILPTLKIFAEFAYERSFSNLATDEYKVRKVSAGVDWEF